MVDPLKPLALDPTNPSHGAALDALEASIRAGVLRARRVFIEGQGSRYVITPARGAKPEATASALATIRSAEHA